MTDYKSELRAAEQEWSEIPQTGDDIIIQKSSSSNSSKFSFITASEFKSEIITEEKSIEINNSTIDNDDHPEPCCCFFPSKPISKEKEFQRKMYLHLTNEKFIDDNRVFNDALFTIYMKLTATDTPPNRFGKHWEEIGFQGNDPKTDFRSAGMLPIYLILKSLKELLPIFEKCQDLDEEHSFPFCVVCINVTVRIMKYVLRKPQKFYKHSKIDQIFLEAMEKFVDFYLTADCTIKDASKCLRRVEDYLEKL